MWSVTQSSPRSLFLCGASSVRAPHGQAQTQADKVGERRRASAIGVLSGVSMAGFVSGTLTSRFLSTTLTFRVSSLSLSLPHLPDHAFSHNWLGAGNLFFCFGSPGLFSDLQVSASVAVSAAVYMRVFLVESNKAEGTGGGDGATEADASQLMSAAKPNSEVEAREESPLLSSRKGASLWDMIRLLRSRSVVLYLLTD